MPLNDSNLKKINFKKIIIIKIDKERERERINVALNRTKSINSEM